MKFLNDVEIGKRLQSLRLDKSAREVALQAGIDPSQYAKIEKGIISISPNIVEKLVKAYNWDKDFILYGHGINVPHETTVNESDSAYDLKEELIRLLKEKLQDQEKIHEQEKKILELELKLAAKIPVTKDTTLKMKV